MADYRLLLVVTVLCYLSQVKEIVFESRYERIKQAHTAKTYVERVNDVKEFKKVLRTKINVLVLFANGLNGLYACCD